MTDVLLAYISVAFTVYAAREWRSAARFRRDSMQVHRDKVRAELVALDKDLLLEAKNAGRLFVAGGRRGSHEHDGDAVEPVSHSGVLS